MFLSPIAYFRADDSLAIGILLERVPKSLRRTFIGKYDLLIGKEFEEGSHRVEFGVDSLRIEE